MEQELNTLSKGFCGSHGLGGVLFIKLMVIV